jgi:hypothetical protein
MSFLKCRRGALYVFLPFALVVLSLGSIQQKSPTYDETIHLFAGYAYLRWGDYRINPEHPPLVKMIAAAPLLGLGLDTSGITPSERRHVQRDKNYGWVLGHRFAFVNNDAETLFFYSRLVMVFFAVALALSVAAWAKALYGADAGLVALILVCLDPNIIGHASIVQTDVPFALFLFGASFFFWRSLTKLTWFNLLATAGLFSAAALTKFSFILIVPIWLVLGSMHIFAAAPSHSPITTPSVINGPWRKVSLLALVLVLSLLVGYLAIWAAYQFRFDASLFQRGQFNGLPGEPSWWSWLLQLCRDYMLLPEAMLFGLGDAYRRMERTAYLLGEISHNGFWLYFPVAFLVKTPVPTLLLALLSLGWMVLHRPKPSAALVVLTPALIFLAFAIWSRLNVGWRHILPIYPFLFVWIAGMTVVVWRSGYRSTRLGLTFLAVWLMASTLWAYPNYLSYFNEAIGGPSRGHAFLVDSSLDWGQDLKSLKSWMTRNRVERIQFAYFGTADPAYYEIDADYLPGSVYVADSTPEKLTAAPSHVAISETFLAGLYLDQPERYAAFRRRAPVAILGHTIRVYKAE